MAVFQLSHENIFPDPNLANPDGLLAVGGDLSVERLLLAYQNGIFPWFEDDNLILWWSPTPRLVLYLEDFKLSHSMQRIIKSGKFDIKYNSCFSEVIEACAAVKRKGEEGTWITSGMKNAYLELHKEGYAQSVEIFLDHKLVGGLYGIAIGNVFCGESMFHTVSNASKVALYYLVELLKNNNFEFIDAQTPTDHLISMGAKEVARDVFLRQLKNNM